MNLKRVGHKNMSGALYSQVHDSLLRSMTRQIHVTSMILLEHTTMQFLVTCNDPATSPHALLNHADCVIAARQHDKAQLYQTEDLVLQMQQWLHLPVC